VGSPSGEEIDEYAEFAADVARRYPKALAIEVWNEPNWKHFWAPKPDPLRYSRLVRAAADAVHATGTGVPVILAGNAPLATDWDNGKGMSFDGFLRQVYEEGGIGRAAAVSHHIYFGKVRDRVLTMRQQIGRIRAVMSAHGDASLPLWITEVGLSSTEETDLHGQGPGLAQIYDTLRRIDNIPVVLVHRFFEGRDALGPGLDHRGIIAADGDPKPAYCDLARARGVVPASC
jgi:polysaccharide biosynthesis protein PslG